MSASTTCCGWSGEDLRALPFDARRARLEAWMAKQPRQRFEVSPLVLFTDWAATSPNCARSMRSDGIEGPDAEARRLAPIVAGRPKGPWFKWKRDPMLADCVLMYAQRGHGKRSSFYSDFTFGCWREASSPEPASANWRRSERPILASPTRNCAGSTRWVRDHTTNRFGPVREVEPMARDLEIAFDGIARSTRHKSGARHALSAPLNRIRDRQTGRGPARFKVEEFAAPCPWETASITMPPGPCDTMILRGFSSGPGCRSPTEAS